MRMNVAPILCAAAAILVGCSEPPPPKAPVAPAPPPPPVAVVAPPHDAPPPPPKVKKDRKRHDKFDMAGDAIKLPGPVVFKTGSDQIDPVSDDILEIVHDYLEAKPDISLLRIEGHTDSDGSPPMNQTLSEKRALSVSRWLVGVGIDCHRLIPVGFGETKPVVPNTTPDNKAQNRRVMFINAAVKGKPLGGKPTDGGGKLAGDPCK